MKPRTNQTERLNSNEITGENDRADQRRLSPRHFRLELKKIDQKAKDDFHLDQQTGRADEKRKDPFGLKVINDEHRARQHAADCNAQQIKTAAFSDGRSRVSRRIVGELKIQINHHQTQRREGVDEEKSFEESRSRERHRQEKSIN